MFYFYFQDWVTPFRILVFFDLSPHPIRPSLARRYDFGQTVQKVQVYRI